MSSNIFEKWTIKDEADAAAAMLAMALEDMQAAGLIDLSPDKEISLVEPDKEFSLAPRLNGPALALAPSPSSEIFRDTNPI